MSSAHLPQDAATQTAIELAVRALADTFRAHERLLRVFVLLGMREARIAETGARASHEGGRLFRDLLWPYRAAFTSPEAEHAIDIAHRLVYAACMHRVLHGPNAESPTPLSWDDLTQDLVQASSLYLLGSLPACIGLDHPGQGKPLIG